LLGLTSGKSPEPHQVVMVTKYLPIVLNARRAPLV
jgi:hypothetical protein